MDHYEREPRPVEPLFHGDGAGCRLCIELKHPSEGFFSRAYPEFEGLGPLYVGDHVSVIYPVGPLCVGHVLVATRTHANSFSNAGSAAQHELKRVLQRLGSAFEERGYELLFFEHGSNELTPNLGSCCLDHAHTNVLPVRPGINLAATLEESGIFVEMRLDELAQGHLETPYLLCGQRDSVFTARALGGTSQFFRRLLGPLLGTPAWDWRSDARADVVAMTSSFFAGMAFSE